MQRAKSAATRNGGGPEVPQGRHRTWEEGSSGTSSGWLGQLLDKGAHYGGLEKIVRPYQEGGWVHSALKSVGSAVRQCPLVFYTGDPLKEKGATALPDDHPLHALFRRPNPYMTSAKFFEAGVYHRKLDGEDFWWCFNEQKRLVTLDGPDELIDYPSFILPVRGSLIELQQDQFGFPGLWKYDTGKGSAGIQGKPHQVYHFSDYDPDNPLRGLGDVEVLLRDLGLEVGAYRYLEAMLLHSGDPGGVITTENEMSAEEEERASEEAEERFSLQNAGRWQVVSGKNIAYNPNKFGPKDMQFQEMLKWVLDRTASVLGVPKEVLGMLEEASYSNFQVAVGQFWQGGNGVQAYMASVEDTINNVFIPHLKDSAARNYVARFDCSQVEALRDDNMEKFDQALKLAQGNAGLSFEEAAMMVGLEDERTQSEFGKIAWLPPNITTAEAALKGAEHAIENPGLGMGQDTPPNPDNEPDDDAPFPGSADGDTAGEDEARAAPTARTRGDAANASPEGSPPTVPDEALRTYYKVFEDRVLLKGERKVKRAASTFLRKYELAQVKRLEDFAGGRIVGLSAGGEKAGPVYSTNDLAANAELMEGLLLAYTKWVAKLAESMEIPLAEVLEASAAEVVDEVGGVAMGRTDPWALEYLRGQQIQLSEGVNSTLAKLVKKTLVEVFEQAPFDVTTLEQHILKNLPELKGSLKKAFKNRESRASTIARTETGRAANGTRFQQMDREGVVKHQWVTSGDVFVRTVPPNTHDHVVLDGVVRNLGDSFRDQTTLRHPLDPHGQAGDVINCRCLTRPIVED